MTELDKVLNKDLSEATKKTYSSMYKKLVGILGNDILKTSNPEIIKKIKELDGSPNTIDGLIKIAIIVKKANKKATKTLDKYKAQYQKEIEKFNDNKKEELSKTILKPQDLYDYLEMLKNSDGKVVEYIINYLIIHFNTRNKDLDLKLINKKSDINDKENFLYINKKTKKITYIRNDYKTAKTYGEKTNVIDDKDFYDKVNNLNLGKLINVAKTSFNKTIQRLTLNEIGSGMYMKILSSQAKPKDLKAISKNRGTSIETIVENYIV
jgi:hypothetical protein